MDNFIQALDQLDPTQYPEAARQAVMRLTDAELLSHRIWAGEDEPKRRQREQDRAQAQAELVVELQAQHPELAPTYSTEVEPAATVKDLLGQLVAWVKPTSRASSYPPASLVKHNDKAWRAHRLTDKEPGTAFDGWEDVTTHFLTDAPIIDGDGPDANTTDAPGLITEPKQPESVAPAKEVPEWKAGESVKNGDTRTLDGRLYVVTDAHKTSDLYRPDKGKKWMLLN